MTVAKRAPGQYWSSCCGEPAEYVGYYRCTGCQAALSMSRLQEPHLTGDSREAARIRQQRAEAEVTADGRLF